MTVSPILATYGTAAAGGQAATPTATQGALDKDAFLELLVASLKYQDPSSPMDTSELMAQTTVSRLAERRDHPNLPPLQIKVPVRLNLVF